MNIYEVLVIVTFVMCAIIMISQYIDSEVPKVCDVLQLIIILPCHKIIAFKNGKSVSVEEALKK